MEDDALRTRRLATQRAYYRLAGQASEGARVIESEHVTAAVVPAVPERSVINSVIYDDADALLAQIDDIAAAYDEAGVSAWTVWVPGGDDEVATALGERGHVLDATPEAMARPLDGARRPDPDPLEDWSADTPLLEVCAVNDRAYPGFEDDPFTRAFAGLPTETLHTYAARLEGRPVSAVLAHDHDGDCGIWAVAALPEARGRGLTTALMGHVLADARERGCETTSLEATQMGRPVYERLGYRPLGAVEMWEKRTG